MMASVESACCKNRISFRAASTTYYEGVCDTDFIQGKKWVEGNKMYCPNVMNIG